jgi:CrcB protein
MIAIGGAAGAVCRYSVASTISSLAKIRLGHDNFPYGTLTVNLIGSFLIGIMYVLIAERMTLHPDWRNVIMVGFLGAFTTFSTFSLEAITLLENGLLLQSAIYVMSSLLLCFVAVWIEIVVTRMDA